MRKKILIGCLLLSCGAYSQVGVNVPLPLAAFHVDGSKNNPIGVAPSEDEAKDDFVITKEGKVGLGTFSPQATLDINGKIRMVDGNQGDSKVMMFEADGKLKWQSIDYIVPTLLGKFEQGTVTSSDSSGPSVPVYSKGYITLTKGRWIVNAGLTMNFENNTDVWIHGFLSTNKTKKEHIGIKLTGAAGNDTAYASRIKMQVSGLGLLSGSSVVNVTSDQVTIYLLVERNTKWSFGSNSWENYFYAIPIL